MIEPVVYTVYGKHTYNIKVKNSAYCSPGGEGVISSSVGRNVQDKSERVGHQKLSTCTFISGRSKTTKSSGTVYYELLFLSELQNVTLSKS